MASLGRRWTPAAACLVAACAGGHYRPVSDTPVRIGKPYTVRGVTYVPAEDATYDMLGYASWYGSDRASAPRTANASAPAGRRRHTPPCPCPAMSR